jgi:hypothetical protein
MRKSLGHRAYIKANMNTYNSRIHASKRTAPTGGTTFFDMEMNCTIYPVITFAGLDCPPLVPI